MKSLYDSHMHTPLCKHAVGMPDEYAAEAIKKGLRGITFTCHNPVPDWSPQIRMADEEFESYVLMVRQAQTKWEGELEIYLGLESDYIPGMELWLTELHARVPLSYILGSVHPHLGQYKERFYKGDIQEFQKTYFNHLVEAAETGLFHALAHPDLVKNNFPDEWNYSGISTFVRTSLDRIAKTGIAMELNTSGLQKTYPEMNPGVEMLKDMAERGIPVVLGSDAHTPERVGANFKDACEMLTEAGYERLSYFINGERKEVPVPLG